MRYLKELSQVGVHLGYTGTELREFGKEQQALERDERAAAREAEKERLAREAEKERLAAETQKRRS